MAEITTETEATTEETETTKIAIKAIVKTRVISRINRLEMAPTRKPNQMDRTNPLTTETETAIEIATEIVTGIETETRRKVPTKNLRKNKLAATKH